MKLHSHFFLQMKIVTELYNHVFLKVLKLFDEFNKER